MYLNVLLKPGALQKVEITEQISTFTEKMGGTTVNLRCFRAEVPFIYPGYSEQSAEMQQSAICHQRSDNRD